MQVSDWGSDACLEWQGKRNKKGYARITQGSERVLLHRLVWEAAHGPLPDGLCVLHRCDNPPCYRLSHLFTGTVADNNADRSQKGRTARQTGALNGRAQVTDEQTQEIRRRYREGELQRVIGEDYGLSQSQVSKIVRQVAWPSD